MHQTNLKKDNNKKLFLTQKFLRCRNIDVWNNFFLDSYDEKQRPETNGISSQGHRFKNRMAPMPHPSMVSDSDDDERNHERKDIFQKRHGTLPRSSREYFGFSKTPENYPTKEDLSSRLYKDSPYPPLAIASPLHSRLTALQAMQAGYIFTALDMQNRANKSNIDWSRQVKHWPTTTNLSTISDGEHEFSFSNNKPIKREHNFKQFRARVSVYMVMPFFYLIIKRFVAVSNQAILMNKIN